MVPPFDDDGLLPPGIHQSTMEELAERFGRESEIRRAEMDSLFWLVDLAKRAGAIRLIVNGSFVTDILDPNDVDCVLLVDASFPKDRHAEAEILAGLPFLDVQIVEEPAINDLVQSYFASDRFRRRKGMVELPL